MSALVACPQSEAEVRELVLAAIGGGRPLEARGGGTHRDVGAPDRERTIVDLSALTGVIDYQPRELTLTARAATPLADIELLLHEHGQMLAFEPFDYAPIFARPCAATLGGVIAAGIAGPRRVSAGGARDHVLGFSAISGRGEPFKGGGKVVKNVTGFDLSKLMAGSWGQISILTELTLRVAPRPPVSKTIACYGLSPETAIAAMAQAMGSSASVAAAAHLPAMVDGESVTALKLEGFHESVTARLSGLATLLRLFGGGSILTDEDADQLWRSVREARPLAGQETLWRAHTAPSRAAELARHVENCGGSWIFDWAGAFLWAGVPTGVDVRSAAQTSGGHTTLVRAPPAVRAATPARKAQSGAITALNRRIKQGFDPSNILDPHRFG